MVNARFLRGVITCVVLTSSLGCTEQPDSHVVSAFSNSPTAPIVGSNGPVTKSLYLIQLSESSRTEFGTIDFGQQGYEQKVFSAIWELESLVNNGGFQGYFGNGAVSASFATTALRAIEAHQCAAMLEEALALVSASLPNEFEERWEAIHSLPEPVATQFEALDTRFFAYPDDLTELLFAFVSRHPEVFGPTPALK